MVTQLQEPQIAESTSLAAGRWLNLVAHLDPRFGGISAVMPSFCDAVSSAGTDAALVPFCAPGEQYETSLCPPIDVLPLGLARWLSSAELRQRLRNHVKESAGVHMHGIWQEHCLFGVQAARALGKPYVISAHGMLEPWALQNKGWKKRLYSALIEQRNVTGAACLHALTGAEAEEYRNFGAKNLVAVIPNGVRVPEAADDRLFFELFPHLKGKRILLYLSRLHFKKGLDLLCKAWKGADPDEEHHLVLAGPDFEGTKQRIEGMLAELGIGRSVSFAGMLRGDAKWSALAAAEAFVLPSRSEGLSVAVLEAMGMGRPVLVTSRCNVPEVGTRKCGWMIAPDEGELTEALRDYFESSSRERARMGQNGREVIRETYTWESVGRKMSALYEWLAGGGVWSGVPSGVDLRLKQWNK